MLMVLVIALGHHPSTPIKTSSTPTGSIQNPNTTSTQTTTPTPPNFNNGGGTTQPQPGNFQNKYQQKLTDPQDSSPKTQTQEQQKITSHPLFQVLPVSQDGVSLSIGDFGTASQPGILVTYTGTLVQAHAVVTQVFKQYHDSQSSYQIQYAQG